MLNDEGLGIHPCNLAGQPGQLQASGDREDDVHLALALALGVDGAIAPLAEAALAPEKGDPATQLLGDEPAELFAVIGDDGHPRILLEAVNEEVDGLRCSDV